MHVDVLQHEAVEIETQPLSRFERVGTGRDLPVDATIGLVTVGLGIERGDDPGRIEIVDDDVGQLAGQLVRLAWLPHVGRDGGAVRLYRIDLALLQVLDHQSGIGDLAAATGTAAGIEAHRQRRRSERGRCDARILTEHVAVEIDQGAVRWCRPDVKGAGIVAHRQLRNLVGSVHLSLADLIQRDVDAGDVDAVGRKPGVVDLANAGALDASDLDLRLRLAAGRDRDVLDGQRPAHHVEPDLAVVRFAATGANLLERGLDLGPDPVLDIKVEAEPSARREHGCHGQADQDSLHSQLQLFVVRCATWHIR